MNLVSPQQNGPTGSSRAGYSEEPEYLGQELADALARDERVGELGLEVTASGGALCVRGAVTTELRRRAVVEVLNELAPGTAVQNEVTVVASSAPSVEQL